MRSARILPVLRVLAVALLAFSLFPCVVALCAGVSLRRTAANPAYLMDVVRQNDVLALVKSEFLDSLVASSELEPDERTALREALDEGIPVAWLDAQLQRILVGLAAYLNSDSESNPTIELPIVELKVVLLPAIREHLGERFYLQAAFGFQSVPDTIDIGASFNTQSLRVARPFWRMAARLPWAAAGGSLVLSVLLWLVAGRGAQGVATAGGVWAAAGVVVTAVAVVAGMLANARLPGALSLGLPELRSIPLLALVSTGVQGLRSELLAVGTGAALAGMAALSLPRADREGPASRRARLPR